MTKTKFNFSILKYSSETDTVIRAICSHNEGTVPLCQDDFISYYQFRRAQFPSLYANVWFEKTDTEGEMRMTEDGGKTWALLLQEITIEELETEPKEEKEEVL